MTTQPRKPAHIIIQYTGSSPAITAGSNGEAIIGNASHARIIIITIDEVEQIVYTGPEFSESEYKKRQADRKSQEKPKGS